MTVSQFQRFLNDEQRDPRLNELLYPYYTLDRAAEMIQKFESDDTFKKKSNLYSKINFFYLFQINYYLFKNCYRHKVSLDS